MSWRVLRALVEITVKETKAIQKITGYYQTDGNDAAIEEEIDHHAFPADPDHSAATARCAVRMARPPPARTTTSDAVGSGQASPPFDISANSSRKTVEASVRAAAGDTPQA